MEDRLKAKLFEVLSENVDVGIGFIDTDNIIQYLNQKMLDLEGVDKNVVLGKNLFDSYPFDCESSNVYKALNTGKSFYNKEQPFTNYKGKKIFATYSAIPVYDNGEMLGVLELAVDNTLAQELSRHILDMGKENQRLDQTTDKKTVTFNRCSFDSIKGDNKDLKKAINKAKKQAKLNSDILIYGETGTGKELFAQCIHSNSMRKDKTFLIQNCAALPSTLLESILFGTVKGSFTGATDRAGLFEQANGGTLVLDELNSMPLYLQAKLLRAVENKRIRRLGSSKETAVDVRVIGMVNEEPFQCIEEERLRKDLFYRLSTFYIQIPPLRHSKDDIIMLANYFIDKHCRPDVDKPTLSKEVIRDFLEYDWPGNIRELENMIEGALALLDIDDKNIKKDHLPAYFIYKMDQFDKTECLAIKEGEFSLQEEVEEIERGYILDALDKAEWNINQAAGLLGIKRQTLQHKIKKYNLL